MTKAIKMATSNLPFIVGSITIGIVCCKLKSAMPLWALILLPRFNYEEQPLKEENKNE